MRKGAIVSSLLFSLIVPGLQAHEGHEHKVMGTVMVVEKAHLEVETSDGEKVSILLNEETKYLRGKLPATVEDIKVGDRIVVTVAEEGGTQTALEVLLAAKEQTEPRND